MSHVHVVGAGLAGLAAALRLSGQPGLRVTLWEATGKAGGRCWSFHDSTLDRVIDNGNHLILSGNREVFDHARRVGAVDRLRVAPEAAFPFVDLADGASWTVRVPRSPLGLGGGDAFPPGARLGDLAGLLRLLAARRDASLADIVGPGGGMWRSFWEPMSLAVLNTPPERASAALLRAALVRSFLRGAAASRPVFAPDGLGEVLVAPAVAHLAERGVDLRFRRRLAEVETEDGRARALRFADGEALTLHPRDAAILALPPEGLAAVLPGLAGAGPGLSILNAHFRVAPALAARAAPLTGVLGGAAHWLFRRGDVLSVTVSAAEESPLSGLGKEATLAALWRDVARVLGEPAAVPQAARLLRERAATFDQTVAGVAARAPGTTPFANLRLAGDHVETGLPATLEGALRSGRAAGEQVLRHLGRGSAQPRRSAAAIASLL